MAEAETADANAKPRPQTQNTGRAGGKSCEEKLFQSSESFDHTNVLNMV